MKPLDWLRSLSLAEIMTRVKIAVLRAFAAPPPTLAPYGRQHTSVTRRVGQVIGLLAFSFFCLIYGFIYALVAPYLLMEMALPLIVLALVVIWALPEIDHAPTSLIVFLLFSFIVTIFLWPRYLAFAPPGLPWITFIRLTGFPLALILLVCVSISSPFRRELGASLQATPVVWKALVVFVVTQLISIVFSTNVTHSIQRVIESQITWTSIFFASCYVFMRPGRTLRLAVMLWAMALVLSTIGVVEMLNGQVPWAGHIPSFFKIEDETVLRILAGVTRSITGVYRVQSTFTTSLGLAEYLALSVPFVLHFAIGPYRWWVRVLALASIPFMLFVVFTTDSRLGIVGFFLALVLYPAFWGFLRWRRDPSSIFGPAVVLAYPAFFAAAVASTFVVRQIRYKVWGTGAHQFSNQSRLDMYREGIPMVIERPVGYGAGMAAETLGFTDEMGTVSIDTYYLAIALDYGILGFVAFYTVFIAAIYYGGKHVIKQAKTDRDTEFLVPITICLVSFVVIKSVFSNPDNHPLMFVLMGAVAALVHRIKSQQSQPS